MEEVIQKLCNTTAEQAAGCAVDATEIQTFNNICFINQELIAQYQMRNTAAQNHKHNQADCTHFYRAFATKSVDYKHIQQTRNGGNKTGFADQSVYQFTEEGQENATGR